MCQCGIKNKYEGNEAIEFLKRLNKISYNAAEWKTLYQCPDCNEYWELSYPQSELHGGGPPVAVKLTCERKET